MTTLNRTKLKCLNLWFRSLVRQAVFDAVLFLESLAMISMGMDSFPLWVTEKDEVKLKFVTVIMAVYILSFLVKGKYWSISIKTNLLPFFWLSMQHLPIFCRNLLRILSPLGNLDHSQETGGSCDGPQSFLVTQQKAHSVRSPTT